MTTHELKTWPEFFAAIKHGAKNFECRKDDRGFKIGDVLVLREYIPSKFRICRSGNCGPQGRYTGQELRREVKYILKGQQYGIMEGYVVMALKNLPEVKMECNAKP